MSNEENRVSWNRLSEYYQSTKYISLNDIHYGPYAPGEKELKVLGNIKGLKCLELGCGGGQISIVLSKWGAEEVIGLDISEKQLEYAQALAKKENVDVTFIRGNMEDLSKFNDSSFDLVISAHAMSYVENINKVISETSRILKANGNFVFCVLHPIQIVLWEALEEKSFDKIYPYFKTTRDEWDWTNEKNQLIATFGQTYHNFEDWSNTLIKNGFMITRVIEPKAYSPKQLKEMKEDEIPYQDKEFCQYQENFIKIGQIIPFSLIISAKKI